MQVRVGDVAPSGVLESRVYIDLLDITDAAVAREILLKKHAKSNIEIPFPFVTDKTVKQGLTVFPTLPDSYFADFTDSGPNATLVICVKAALTGKPCPGVLNVRLPK